MVSPGGTAADGKGVPWSADPPVRPWACPSWGRSWGAASRAGPGPVCPGSPQFLLNGEALFLSLKEQVPAGSLGRDGPVHHDKGGGSGLGDGVGRCLATCRASRGATAFADWAWTDARLPTKVTSSEKVNRRRSLRGAEPAVVPVERPDITAGGKHRTATRLWLCRSRL